METINEYKIFIFYFISSISSLFQDFFMVLVNYNSPDVNVFSWIYILKIYIFFKLTKNSRKYVCRKYKYLKIYYS